MLNDYDKIKKGYVKFWRSFIDWEWFTEVNTCHLFQYCILRANRSDTEWRGIKIKKGSFITSRAHLATATGLTERQVRTALKNLKLTNEIDIQTTNQNSIITVNNYNLYQDNDQQNNQATTKQRPSSDQAATTDNNNKNNKNINNNSSSSSSCILENKTTTSTTDISDLNEDRIKDLNNFYGEYKNVHLTSRQLDALKSMILNDSVLIGLINELSENIEQGKEKIYDEKRPGIHFVRLKKYWLYKQNQQAEEKKQEESEYNYGIG
jgi:hypothetical protein